MPLARLSLTSRHRQAWLQWCHERVNRGVEWHSVVFIDESRFCLYASDRSTCVWHRPDKHYLTECNHPWHIGPTQPSWWGGGGINHNLRSLLMFLQGKVTRPLHLQFVNSCYCHFFNKKLMCFSAKKSTYSCCNENVLFVVYNHNSFSRACNNHCWIVTTGPKYLGHTTAGYHLQTLWQFACKITHICCC